MSKWPIKFNFFHIFLLNWIWLYIVHMHLQLDYHRLTPLFAVFTLRRRPKALPSKFFWEAFPLHQPRPGKIPVTILYTALGLPSHPRPASWGWLVGYIIILLTLRVRHSERSILCWWNKNTCTPHRRGLTLLSSRRLAMNRVNTFYLVLPM